MKKSIWPREILPLWELVHVPPMEEENHLPNYLWRGYVSSLEGKSHKHLMTHSECTLKNNYKYNDVICLHPKSPKLWRTLLISMGKPESRKVLQKMVVFSSGPWHQSNPSELDSYLPGLQSRCIPPCLEPLVVEDELWKDLVVVVDLSAYRHTQE